MPKFSANLSMLFQEFDFLDRFEAAGKAGFKGIEYLFPYDFETSRLIDLLQKHSLQQVLHNLPAGDWAKGERGIAIFPDRKGEFQDGVGKTIEYAKALGNNQVNLLAGIGQKDLNDEIMTQTLVEYAAFAAAELAKNDIRLLIEPVNTKDIPGFFLSGSKQCLDIIAATSSDNIKMQYDIYHMQIMEGDLASTIENHISSIGHIQLADNPGRHEPGTGEINYPFLMNFLDQIGYDGWIGCEYIPATTTLEGLSWLQEYK
ncbi:MAG: hydroxypyruvate isomerase [Desulforhopalus sp.]